MNILVTGSEGNIGSKLISYLIKKGYDVYCVDIKQGCRENYSVVDINNPSDLIGIFFKFKPEVVFHLAAMVSRVTCETSPSLAIQTNVSGTGNIIQLCKTFNCKLINFSTSEVYGNIDGVLSEIRTDIKPNNLYGLSKLLAEKLVEYEVLNNGLKAITVRPFMIYDEEETIGDHRSVMVRFAYNLIKGRKIDVHINSKRSWLHINDAVKIFEAMIPIDKFYVVNIGDENVYDIKFLAKTMCSILGLQYSEYVNEIELPEKMTLKKMVDLERQKTIISDKPEYEIVKGIRLLIENIKNNNHEKFF